MSTISNKEKLIAGAQKLVEKGQFDKAIREYLKVVAEDETDVRIWIRIGDLYVKLGQKSEAGENYKKVAQLYAKQGEPEKAVAVYKQILQIDPQGLETHRLLAALYRDMGRLQHATQQYELAAQVYTRAGKTREALLAEQAIVDMQPDHIGRRIKLAELYSREKLYPEAAREFLAAAAVLRSTGRMDDFAKVSERLLFHAPDNLEVTKDLSRYYLQQGDAVRALTKLQVAFKVDRKDVELLDLLAQSFERMSKPDKAVSVLRELARIYSERGALSAADSVNRRILELDPKDDAARAALSHSGPSRRVGSGPGGGPGQSGSNSNLNASLFNSPVPQLTPSSGVVPLAAGSGPVPAITAVSAAVTPAFGSVSPSGQQVAYAAEEEAARVIAEAESFSRFGLAKKAVEHLMATLQGKPGLRQVRERLARFYEAQGQPRSALAELRLLLSQAPGAAEELRLLREIVRLDTKDEAAATRLRALSASASAATAATDEDDDEPEISVSSSGADDTGHRRVVPSDADTTSRMPLAQFHKFVQNQSLLRTMPPTAAMTATVPVRSGGVASPAPGPAASQTTQPNSEVVAAAAEEMALTSGTLKEELDEVDFFLQQKMFDEAQQLLKSLLTRYPHSKTVQAKQKEVAGLAVVDDVVIDVDLDEVRDFDQESTARLRVGEVTALADESPTDKTAAAKKPSSAPAATGGRVPPPSPPARGATPAGTPGMVGGSPPINPSPPVGHGLPAPSSASLPQAVPASGRSLPPSGPNRLEKTAASAEASGAFRLGVSYRNRGQYAQAVTEFHKALADQKRAARAALMLGLCYRDQNLLKEAIEAFKEGVHMPGISEPDLGELHYQLGRSYEQLADVGEAVHFYQLALKPSGRFKDAENRIATLQGKSSRSLR